MTDTEPAPSDITKSACSKDTAASASTVWYGCKYAPVELLTGFGARVEPLFGEVDSFDVADRLANANLCGYGKALLTLALRPDVQRLVLTNCCDVTRRVYEILAQQRDFEFLWMLDLPHKSGPREVERWRTELERMAQAYAQATGETFDVARACAAFEPPVPQRDPHVTILGAHAPLTLVDDARAALPVPVENLTCTGRRLIQTPPPQLARAPHDGACHACEAAGDAVQAGEAASAAHAEAGDGLTRFLDWYAGALLGQMPCMRMDDVDARASLHGGAGQEGVVYHTMKFCDYYGFEYAAMSENGDTNMLKVETDGTSQSAGQLRTRLEAFGETLRARLGRGGTGSNVPAGPATHDDPAGHAGHAAAPKTAACSTAPTGHGAVAAPDAIALGAASHPARQEQGQPHAPAVVQTRAARTLPDGRPRYVVGVDSGSTTTDAALIDMDGQLVAGVIIRTGAKASAAAQSAIDQALAQAGATRDQVALYVSTGYGRDVIEGMDAAITEITCHARGAHYLAPDTRTVIDIGGQDSKAIHLDEHGGVENFVMNDKCAAGTGRFLEMMAHTLEMPLEELSRAGLSSTHDVRISNMCSVFAESEVVSLIADDTPTADIVHGLCMSVATKTKSLARRVNAEPAYLMTGGVANNEGVVRALSEVLGAPVHTHKDSQLCGAIGAALLGLERLG